ncbi:MAG: hypothetical protein WCI77_00760 [Candidatus Omnitrophota bacterium]
MYATIIQKRSKYVLSIMNLFKKHWPLVTVLIIFWCALLTLLDASLEKTSGHLIYALDDPYIHMAVAKNFVQHGVWGVTKYRFSSAVSSLSWPLLLAACYAVFGVNELAPFILNCIFVHVLIWFAYVIMKKNGFTPFFSFVILLFLLFVTPLPSLIFGGQEHILHTLCTMIFAYYVSCLLCRKKQAYGVFLFFQLGILSCLVTMARYEGIFIILAAAFLLSARKKFMSAFLLVAISLLPLAIYGFIAVKQGAYFLPNSIILKSKIFQLYQHNLKNLISFDYDNIKILFSLFLSPLVMAAIITGILLKKKEKSFWHPAIVMSTLFIMASLPHMFFVGRGHGFSRYEAYLVAFGIVSISFTLHSFLPVLRMRRSQPSFLSMRIFSLIAIVLLSGLLMVRAVCYFLAAPLATKNVYDQQYHMGLFLKKYYQGQTVVLNDIGLVNYLADIRCLDLYGLMDGEIANAKLSAVCDTQYVYNFAKVNQAKVAIVYDLWVRWACGAVPPQWLLLGQWRIKRNVICGDEVVSLYAVDPSERKRLVTCLRDFSNQLPYDVKQSGEYRQ